MTTWTNQKKWFLGAIGTVVVAVTVMAAMLIPAEEAIAQNPPMGYSYAVKFVCGNVEQDTPWLTQGVYRTEINIYNQAPDRQVHIDKSAVLLVQEYDAIGREPDQQPPIGTDVIDLNPLHGTMDDCERIAHIMGLPWPTNGVYIGFLDIVAMEDLTVDAVYTSRNEPGGGSIEVERVEGKVRCP